MAIVINSVEASARVIAKINGLHHLTLDDVEDALESVIRAGFEEDEDRGRRLLVKCNTRRGILRVVLYPLDEANGTYRLGSAFY